MTRTEDPGDSLELIVDTLRRRILRAVQSGALRAGDRLPSARDLVREFKVDHRVILAAYRELANEGLVALRQRGGVYVDARHGSDSSIPSLPEGWLVETFTQALAREIPAPELHEWLRRLVETLRLRAAVIASTEDQTSGLCRELRDDFGLDADGILASELIGGTLPLPVRRADVLVTTEAHGAGVHTVAARLGKPVVVVRLRPDLTVGEWALLLRRPVYAIVATPEFERMLRDFFADVPGVENLRVLVLGRDDLASIPDGAPTYVTQRVRAAAGNVPIRGRILPAARTISAESAREIFTFIVRSNLEALARLTR